jgi:hypothetical protein
MKKRPGDPASAWPWDRSGLCYPSDLTDAEWAMVEPCLCTETPLDALITYVAVLRARRDRFVTNALGA